MISNIFVFAISYYYLIKYTGLKITATKFIVKPLIATFIMTFCTWNIYKKLPILGNSNLKLVFSFLIGGIIYIISIFILKILSKEEIYMLPFGNKVYKPKKLKS